MNKFAAFDIDGTLIRCQLYHTVVDRLAKQNFLGEEVYQKLHQSRMKWKRRESSEGFSAYEKVLIEAFESTVQAIPTKTFDAIADEVIEEYKDQVYTYTRDLISNLKKNGYFLIAISGSHEELVERIAKYYHFDVAVGSKYKRQHGKFSGEAFIASHHKKIILKELIKKYALETKESYAIGDSKSDAPMLEMVENPIVFNPDRELYKIAKNKNWNIVIERKNMVYTLKYSSGNYVLTD